MYQNITTPSVTIPLDEIMTIFSISSEEVRNTFQIIFNAFLGPVLAGLGMVANIINMVVYWKQGVSETTTMSFFALSFADFNMLLNYFWSCIYQNPWLEGLNISEIVKQLWYYAASLLMTVFFRISCWITIYITLERCLCVAVPLKVKQIITPRRTRVVLTSIFVVNMLLYIVPLILILDVIESFDADTNRTRMYVRVRDNEVIIIDSYKDISMLFSSFVSLTVVTSVLTVQLKRAVRWRVSTSSSVTKSVPVKEKKVMKMVCLITTIFILCFLPDIIFLITYLAEEEFHISKGYRNLVVTCWSFAFACHGVNANVNIFVYYRMSSRYRNIFKAIFSRRRYI